MAHHNGVFDGDVEGMKDLSQAFGLFPVLKRRQWRAVRMIVNNYEAGSAVTQTAFHDLTREGHNLIYRARSQEFLPYYYTLTVQEDQQQLFFSHSAKPSNEVAFHFFRVVEHMPEAFRFHSKAAGDLTCETNLCSGIVTDSCHFRQLQGRRGQHLFQIPKSAKKLLDKELDFFAGNSANEEQFQDLGVGETVGSFPQETLLQGLSILDEIGGNAFGTPGCLRLHCLCLVGIAPPGHPLSGVSRGVRSMEGENRSGTIRRGLSQHLVVGTDDGQKISE